MDATTIEVYLDGLVSAFMPAPATGQALDPVQAGGRCAALIRLAASMVPVTEPPAQAAELRLLAGELACNELETFMLGDELPLHELAAAAFVRLFRLLTAPEFDLRRSRAASPIISCLVHLTRRCGEAPAAVTTLESYGIGPSAWGPLVQLVSDGIVRLYDIDNAVAIFFHGA